jgi:hypothetical protein
MAVFIDQRDHDNLREGENFWIGMLLTNQEGLNSHHDFVQQLCHNFYRFILI